MQKPGSVPDLLSESAMKQISGWCTCILKRQQHALASPSIWHSLCFVFIFATSIQPQLASLPKFYQSDFKYFPQLHVDFVV